MGKKKIPGFHRTAGTKISIAKKARPRYRRFFSRRRWSMWPLGRALVGDILEHWVSISEVMVAGADVSNPAELLAGLKTLFPRRGVLFQICHESLVGVVQAGHDLGMLFGQVLGFREVLAQV